MNFSKFIFINLKLFRLLNLKNMKSFSKTLNNKAFTLLEIVISLFILSIISLGIAASFYTSLSGVPLNEDLRTANILAQRVMETELNKAFANVTNITNTTFEAPYSNFNYNITVDTLNTTDLKSVRVRVNRINATNNPYAELFNYVFDPTIITTRILLPNGPGDFTQLTGNPPPNWLACRSDDEATFVSSSGRGNFTDLYNLNDTSGTGTINSVTIFVKARVTGAAPHISLQTVIRLGLNELRGSLTGLTTTYALYSTTHTTKPGGGSWTWNDINNLQAGVFITNTHPQGQHDAQVTYVYVQID